MLLPICFYDTLSRQKKNISLIDPTHLKFYVCGPTVYERPHLGNARSVVIYDLFYRFFNVIFDKVTYVRNITDIDDKINKSAREQSISIKELTKKIIEFFYHDISALKVLKPSFEPKATDHIADMIIMIEQLIKGKFAYESEGHVLFNVCSYKDYGILSNRNLDEMIAGARIEVAEYKKNPLDFVLWKPAAEDDDISSIFDSPWGRGRPGWHIECSAMSSKYLGVNFDIHGGGADLQFPHHENEIAQSCCANKGSTFANYWLHNGFLTVNGEKMSKSLKNFITVKDLLDQEVPGVVIRYLLLSTHYRKPLDFNEKSLQDAKKSLDKFYENLKEGDIIDDSKIRDIFKRLDFGSNKNIYLQQIMQFLADDFNISKVIALLHDINKKAKKDDQVRHQLVLILNFLGLLDNQLLQNNKISDVLEVDERYIEKQIELRIIAKQNKDYAKADQIRNDLLKKGISLEDISGGKTKWNLV